MPHALPSFDAFRIDALAAGFDEVLERQWAADAVVDTHTHAFGVSAIVAQGEMWLTCGGQTRHLKAGDRFEMAPHTPHDERYGPQGAVYWVARRNPPVA